MTVNKITYSPNLAGTMKEFCGSQSDDFNNRLFNQITTIQWRPDMSEKDINDLTHGILAVMQGLAPRDEIEGMLIAQMVAAHNAVMDCYRQAMLPRQRFEGKNQSLAFANKLSRTYAALIDALQRYRGKGQQKVTVEHVHVHAGGQAVVGNIEHTPGGGGMRKMEEQPHAKQIEQYPSIDASVQAVPGQNTERQLVPITGDAERAVPDARRPVDWRSERE